MSLIVQLVAILRGLGVGGSTPTSRITITEVQLTAPSVTDERLTPTHGVTETLLSPS